jgi:hypothetical protein
LQLFNRRLHALKYAVQRRIVNDEQVRCCCSSFIEQRDRITQQRERLQIFDNIHSMKILFYFCFQFFLRVLILCEDRDDDDADVHLFLKFFDLFLLITK